MNRSCFTLILKIKKDLDLETTLCLEAVASGSHIGSVAGAGTRPAMGGVLGKSFSRLSSCGIPSEGVLQYAGELGLVL